MRNSPRAFFALKENDFLRVGKGKKEEHRANYTALLPFKGLLLTLHPIPLNPILLNKAL